MADPLSKKLCKNQPQTIEDLADEQRTATKMLQERLLSSPILALPCVKGRYIVDTNDCDKLVGAVLLQEQPDGRRNQ